QRCGACAKPGASIGGQYVAPGMLTESLAAQRGRSYLRRMKRVRSYRLSNANFSRNRQATQCAGTNIKVKENDEIRTTKLERMTKDLLAPRAVPAPILHCQFVHDNF